jgi:replicative DNA helicase
VGEWRRDEPPEAGPVTDGPCRLGPPIQDLHFQVEPLAAQDTLFLRVSVLGPDGEALCDEPIAADGPGLGAGVCRIGEAVGLDPDQIEAQIATHVLRARRQWRDDQGGRAATNKSFLSGVLDSATFFSQRYERNWLVNPLLVAGEPVIVGGPRKALKSILMADLALSLGSGTPFLGHFAVPRRRRCLVLNGESGEATVQETGARILRARGVGPDEVDVVWGFDLPRLADPEDLRRLHDFVRRRQVEVVVIDPLYLCLIQSGIDVAASNLFQTGPLLLAVSRACLDAGATPVLVHHARKQALGARARAGEPLDLDDLSYSGFAEFARQWLLVSRRSPYEPGSGRHQLWLSVGGSAGQGGLWGVDVQEGQLDQHFDGRIYQVAVQDSRAVRQVLAAERQVKEAERRHERDRGDVTAVAQAFVDRPQGDTLNGIHERTGLGKPRVREAIRRLEGEGRLESCAITKAGGKKATRAYSGWKATPRIHFAGGSGEAPPDPPSPAPQT